MAFWIELRCENRGSDDPECWSYNNEGCGQLAEDSLKDAYDTAKSITDSATKEGWKRLKSGWTCPHCCDLLMNTN